MIGIGLWRKTIILARRRPEDLPQGHNSLIYKSEIDKITRLSSRSCGNGFVDAEIGHIVSPSEVRIANWRLELGGLINGPLKFRKSLSFCSYDGLDKTRVAFGDIPVKTGIREGLKVRTTISFYIVVGLVKNIDVF